MFNIPHFSKGGFVMFDEIVTLVNTTGFPIACVICLAMSFSELNKTHKEEINALKEQLNNMSIKMQETVDKIEELIRKVCGIDED